MTQTSDGAAVTDEETAGGPEPKPTPLTKAEKLEAKAARLREAELARAARTAQEPGHRIPALPFIVVSAVLALALIAAVIIAVHESSRASDADRAQAAAARMDSLRASALKTATTVATSFGTYDYQTLNADFARTRAYLTPSFASDFSKITASLGSLITQDKGQIVGTVQGVGVESLTGTTAVVLVFLDQKVTTAESSTPRLDHNRVQLTLALQPNKTWLVSKLVLV